MKRTPLIFAICLLSTLFSAYALSLPIGRDIDFPKDFDAMKAKAIRAVIRDQRFNFVEGIVSYWPPDWATRLSFEGDAASLNLFIAELRKIPGIALKLILYKGQNTELRRDSSWQLDFSKAHPDRLAIYLNLNSEKIDFSKLTLPEWKPSEN